MGRLVLIDSNNRAWASFYAYSRLSYEGESVSIIYGLPSIIKSLITKLSPTNMIAVWDGSRDKEREKVLPNYKGERESKDLVDYENWLDQKKVVQSMLNKLGVSQAMNETMEADDLIYSLVRKNIRKYKRITIISADKDFNQLVRNYNPKKGLARVDIFNDSKKLLIDKDNMVSVFGYTPKQTVDYLSLVGDKSDSIPGYSGIGHKRALDLLSKYNSLAAFLKSNDNHTLIKRDILLELVKKNLILIDLVHFHKEFIKGNKSKRIKWLFNEERPKIDELAFRRICAKYNMINLMGKSFINKFKYEKNV